MTLTHELHSTLVKSIEAGRFRLVEKQSLRVSVFEVDAALINPNEPRVPRLFYHIVYDRHRRVIVTVLFPEYMYANIVPDNSLELR